MIYLSFYLDTRYVNKEGKNTLKFRICCKGKKAYITFPFPSLSPNEWDAEFQRVTKSNKNYRALNSQLNSMMSEYKSKVESEYGLKDVPVKDVQAFLQGNKPAKEKDSNVIATLEAYAKLKENRPKSAESFRYTRDKIIAYEARHAYLEWDAIDYKWLTEFRNWMLRGDKEHKAVAVNTAAIHLENLRAVMNYAIDEGLTEKYPFKKFIIEREQVVKPIMSLPDLILLFKYNGQTQQEEYYLDIYRLIFCLCGINIVDLYNARDCDVVGGRLEFNRQKTGVHISIKLEPEALELINKHKGTDGHLVDLHERYASSDNFCSQINKRLKQIGEWHFDGHTKVYDKKYWPYASTYTARRNWATLAGMEDFSMNTIGLGLGHKDSSVTAIYVRPYLRKLDIANRMLLDIVTGKCEPSDPEALM